MTQTRQSLPVVQPRTEYGYERTTCSCPRCSRFCSYVPGMLAPPDLPRMARAAGFSDLFAYGEQYLSASPGAVTVTYGRLVRIPSLVPRALSNGACMHWTDDHLCRIHDVAPYGCAMVDDHMTAAEGSKRSAACLFQTLQDRQRNGPYAQVWLHVWNLGFRVPDTWPKRRTELTNEAMQAVAHGTESERRGAMRFLSLIMSGVVYGDVPS